MWKNTPTNKFAVEADDDVWIQVKIDDKETLSAMLHAGERREWAADKALQVVIGNAGGVQMKWNEHPLAAPRDPGVSCVSACLITQRRSRVKDALSAKYLSALNLAAERLSFNPMLTSFGQRLLERLPRVQLHMRSGAKA